MAWRTLSKRFPGPACDAAQFSRSLSMFTESLVREVPGLPFGATGAIRCPEPIYGTPVIAPMGTQRLPRGLMDLTDLREMDYWRGVEDAMELAADLICKARPDLDLSDRDENYLVDMLNTNRESLMRRRLEGFAEVVKFDRSYPVIAVSRLDGPSDPVP